MKSKSTSSGAPSDPGRDGRSGERPHPRWSLRLRMGGWTATIFAVTLGVLTGASILSERREVLREETAHADAFLTHLAAMPAFQSDLATAASSLGPLRGFLGAVGSSIELVPGAEPGSPVGRPPPREASARTLSSKRLNLREGSFELLYRLGPERLRETTRRSILLHLSYGLLALTALLVGTEWILRKKLLDPLRALSHQVGRMRDGGGWAAQSVATDAELGELAGAVMDLGPGLERQVHEWIEAERRAAVALTLGTLRRRMREPLARGFSSISDLQARHQMTADGTKRLRRLLTDLEEMGRVLTEVEEAVFAGSSGGKVMRSEPGPLAGGRV